MADIDLTGILETIAITEAPEVAEPLSINVSEQAYATEVLALNITRLVWQAETVAVVDIGEPWKPYLEINLADQVCLSEVATPETQTTRLYLPSSGPVTPYLAPDFSPLWDKAGAYRYSCSHNKSGSSFAPKSVYETAVTAPYKMAAVQFVSGPLRAQTIAGFVKGQILAKQTDAASDLSRVIVIRVVDEVGYPRGTLLAHFPGAITSELGTAYANRHFPPPGTALTPLEVQDGDRLVIELGFVSFNTTSSYVYGYLFLGDVADDDLPEDETTQQYLNPWIEFNSSLQWLSETAYAAAGYIKVTGTCTLYGGDDEDVSEYAADGYMEMVGGCDLTTVDSLTTAFAASGSMKMCGESAYDSPPLNHFAASGIMKVCGTCRQDSTTPYVDPTISLITEYAATGGVSIYAECLLGDQAELRKDYVAAGCLLICGGCNLSTPSEISLLSAYVAGGYIMVAGGGGLVQGPVTAYAADTETGPCLEIVSPGLAGFIFPPVTDMAADGGVSMVNAAYGEEEIFETLVLTGARNEVSFYSNFRFNSFATFRGRYYGATKDGIFLLEGNRDDEAEIAPGVRIGPTNFGTDREKRMRLVRCGGECDQARVRIASETGAFEISPVIAGRADASRLVQGREITVDIVDFESLTFLQLIPLILAKR